MLDELSVACFGPDECKSRRDPVGNVDRYAADHSLTLVVNGELGGEECPLRTIHDGLLFDLDGLARIEDAAIVLHVGDREFSGEDLVVPSPQDLLRPEA